jgi:hypothetical protein
MGNLRFFEVAGVLVRLDHVASFIVNADHGRMGSAVKLCVVAAAREKARRVG